MGGVVTWCEVGTMHEDESGMESEGWGGTEETGTESEHTVEEGTSPAPCEPETGMATGG